MIRARKLSRANEGATALEFGLLLTPLLLVLLGFLQLGYESYVRAQLQGALNDVARAAGVEDPNLGDKSLTLEKRIEKNVKDRMASLVKSGTYDFKISNYEKFAGVGRPEVLVNDVDGDGKYDAGDCWEDANPNGSFDTDQASAGVGGADDVVVYEVKLAVPHLVPVSSLIGGSNQFEVIAKTLVRRQPFANQQRASVAC